MMSFIIEHLYLGSEDDAYSGVHLKEKLGITHILTIDCKPLTIEARKDFVYKHLFALDDENTDLLTYLEECNQFINEGREAGGILVHCHAGMSRSGTVVIAYVMQKMSLTLEEAYTLVRCQRPEIRPNPGFMQQLKLYESMHNKVDVHSTLYKTYKLEKIAEQFKNAQDSIVLSDALMVDDPGVCGSNGEAVYKCKKCRRSLFKASSVMSHNKGCGKEVFDQPWLIHQKKEDVPCRQSLFIEPVLWMKSQILATEGKLSCPKCSSKLGSFNWCGERCPCGQWIIPAFHISSGKVDECRARLNPTFVNTSKLVSVKKDKKTVEENL